MCFCKPLTRQQMKLASEKKRRYRMKTPRYQKQRTKHFDLVRRARLLGCDPGHLQKVIHGERESHSLLNRLNKLIETESREAAASGIKNQIQIHKKL